MATSSKGSNDGKGRRCQGRRLAVAWWRGSSGDSTWNYFLSNLNKRQCGLSPEIQREREKSWTRHNRFSKGKRQTERGHEGKEQCGHGAALCCSRGSSTHLPSCLHQSRHLQSEGKGTISQLYKRDLQAIEPKRILQAPRAPVEMYITQWLTSYATLLSEMLVPRYRSISTRNGIEHDQLTCLNLKPQTCSIFLKMSLY